MHALMSKLPAFVLPFVTRSLRGGRGRRYAIFSLLLAALTGIMGLWMTLGAGQLEQSMRTDLGFEEYEYERERQAFTAYVHDEYELAEGLRERELFQSTKLNRQYDDYNYYGEVTELRFEGAQLLSLAASSETYTPEQARLSERARTLLGSEAPRKVLPDEWNEEFAWHQPSEVQRLEAVLAADGIPAVELYRSPLTLREGLAFTGFLAGMLLLALTTIFAPLLVAVQQAQERHENTLMPLTGTALGPRELSVGLASGPGSVIAIFALPQLALFLLCATFAGEIGVAVALVAAMATTSALFMLAAQLLGQLLGHKRTPGIIGIALMSFAGSMWLGSIAIVADADAEMAGFSAIIPQIGLGALLAEVFVDINAGFSSVFLGAFVWTIAAGVLAHLTLTALARKIEGTYGTLLTRTQAGVGAAVCMGLVALAFPDLEHEEAVRQYLGIAMLALPFLALLMARVPTGDGPPRMRKISVPGILLEYGVWIASYFLISALVFGTETGAMHPVALGWLAWCTAVSGLLAIRQTSLQSKALANVWAGFCGFSLMLGFVQACIWGVDNHGNNGLDEMFVFFELSPVLGLIQVALTVWIPISLVRHLRKNLGSIS